MKILVADLETAPIKAYTWGLFNQNISIGQIVEHPRILCWGALWHGDKPKDFLVGSEFYDGRRPMLEAAHNLLCEADAVAHWNGTSFDLPWLLGEFAVEGLPPVPQVMQIDLMRLVKKNMRYPSRKLDYVAGRLESRHKVKHEGFGMWAKCLDGDPQAWDRMIRYMKGDVLLTDRLLTRLKPYVSQLNVNLTRGTTDHCPYCGSGRLQRRGYRYTKVSRYQRYQCQKCFGWSSDGKRDAGAEVRPA